jgi:hypothetical protein
VSQACHSRVAALQQRPGTIASTSEPHKEALVAQTVSAQHPAVVLRTHYRQLRALLAIAMIAVVGLAVTVVILATDNRVGDARSAAPVSAPADAADGPRYIHAPGQRYNGGR